MLKNHVRDKHATSLNDSSDIVARIFADSFNLERTKALLINV
jgi:hypothetical protein